MITCLADVLRPAAGRATVRVLERLGHQVDFPAAQTCCGQPFYNSGFLDLARAQARHTIRAFADCEKVIVPSGSCAAMVKVEYPQLLADDPEWSARADELAARTSELSAFLVREQGIVDVGARYHGTVTYHYSCHQRALGLTDESERLIRQVEGVTYVPLPRVEMCCGFGGSFAVRYPKISTAMVDDKCAAVLDTRADLLVTGDTGCLMNIAGRLHRQEAATCVMHLAELLDCR